MWVEFDVLSSSHAHSSTVELPHFPPHYGRWVHTSIGGVSSTVRRVDVLRSRSWRGGRGKAAPEEDNKGGSKGKQQMEGKHLGGSKGKQQIEGKHLGESGGKQQIEGKHLGESGGNRLEGISGKQLEGTRTKQQVCSVGGASSSTYASTSLPSSLPRFSTGPVTLFALGERVDADSVDATACSVIKRNKEEGEKRRKEEEGGRRRKRKEEGREEEEGGTK